MVMKNFPVYINVQAAWMGTEWNKTATSAQ
jgi:hypothetical protein